MTELKGFDRPRGKRVCRNFTSKDASWGKDDGVFCGAEIKANGWKDAGWHVLKDTVTRFDKKQQAATARFQSAVKYYKKQRNKGDKKNKAGSSGSGCRESSSRELEQSVEERSRGSGFFSIVHKRSASTLSLMFCCLIKFFLGLSFKLGRELWLFKFHRTLLWWARPLMKRETCLREKESSCKCLRSCSFLAYTWMSFAKLFFREIACFERDNERVYF